MDYFKKIKEHWLIFLVILCGVAFATLWMLPAAPKVEPLNSEIEKPPSQPTGMVKAESTSVDEEKSLMKGTSFTSKFGFIVYISGSNSDLKKASMYITLENPKNKNKNHKNVGIGEEIEINHANNNYSIEIFDVRDNWVDLRIRRNS